MSKKKIPTDRERVLVHSIINTMSRIDKAKSEHGAPDASRAESWTTWNKSSLCAYVREEVVAYLHDEEVMSNVVRCLTIRMPSDVIVERHLFLYTDEEIVKQWIRIRKNPQAHGVERSQKKESDE